MSIRSSTSQGGLLGRPMYYVEEQQARKILKHCGIFAQVSIAAATAIFTSAFTVGKDAKLHLPVLVPGGCFLVISFLFATLLLFFKVFLTERKKLHMWHIRALQVLCLASATTLVATNSLLLVLIEEDGLLGLNLLPVQALIGVLAYCAVPTEGSLSDDAFEAAVKSGRKVAVFALGAAFAMQTTLVFGYLKNASFQALGHRFDIAVSFLASSLSVSSVAATCMPLGYRTSATRGMVLSVVRHLKDAVLALLAVTAVTLGREFLGGRSMLTLFPEMAVAAMQYAAILLSAEQGQQDDAVEHKKEVLPNAVVAAFCLAVLGAAYATLLGTPEYDVYTKALVFTLLVAIMSSLARVAGPLCVSPRDKNAPPWVVFLGNILPVVVMLVAVPLAAKVAIDILLVA